MATFWVAAYSFYRMFSLYYTCLLFLLYPILVLIRGWDCGSDCTSSWSLLTFYFKPLHARLGPVKPIRKPHEDFITERSNVVFYCGYFCYAIISLL